MKRITLLILVLSLCLVTLSAHGGHKHGVLIVEVISGNKTVADAKIELYQNDKYAEISGKTDKKGTCVIRDVPVGDFEVRVSKKGYEPLKLETEIKPYVNSKLKAELIPKGKQETGTLAVKVKNEKGELLSYVNVVLYKDGKNTQIAGRTKKNGTCTITNIPPDVYEVRVSKMSYLRATIDKLEIHAGKNNVQSVILRQKSVGMEGVTVKGEKPKVVTHILHSYPGYDNDIEEIDTIESTALAPQSGTRVRGGRKGEVVYSVDGMSVGQPQQRRMPKRDNRYHNYDPIPNAVEFEEITSNEFKTPEEEPYSTFSIDVDTGSYTAVRRMLNDGYLPRKDMIRIEEMINYFDYDYVQPGKRDPFSINTEVGVCPWEKEHYLVHIGLQGKELNKDETPPSNLVFLVDVSGSMGSHNKLPLVQKSLKMLTKQLRPEDTVSIVTYAGAERLALEATKGDNKQKIIEAIDNLRSGGGTAGERGIRLAYRIAKENLLKKGNNRIILCSDGDFNVGVSSTDELVKMVKKENKNNIFLTILGFGMDNLKDNRLESIANKCNGNYGYIDSIIEAKKTFVTELVGSLYTIAKDVKIQVEFNPVHVEAYRLIGYVNRKLAAEDFNDDKKDAGELGAGHTVTALYEVVPAGSNSNFRKVDPTRYQRKPKPEPPKVYDSHIDELLFVKLRYKEPKGTKSKLIERAVPDVVKTLKRTSENFRFSAAVTAYGFMLQDSEFKGNTDWQLVKKLAKNSLGEDKYGYRAEFMQLVEKAELLQENQ